MSLSFNFRLGRSTVCSIVGETCEAIWAALHHQYIKAPTTEREWIGISKQFVQIWNVPNCIGIDDHDYMCPHAGSIIMIVQVLLMVNIL